MSKNNKQKVLLEDIKKYENAIVESRYSVELKSIDNELYQQSYDVYSDNKLVGSILQFSNLNSEQGNHVWLAERVDEKGNKIRTSLYEKSKNDIVEKLLSENKKQVKSR